MGYGFYLGAVICAVLFLITITTFSKLAKNKRRDMQILYFEINDVNSVNRILDTLKEKVEVPFASSVVPAKCGLAGHEGLNLILDKAIELNTAEFCEIDGISFVVEE